MLKITRLKIQGFRSLSSIDLPLESFSLLIGRNNAGKSNILLAIKLLLEASLRDISSDDFYKSDSDQASQAVFEAEIEGFDERLLSLCDEKHRPRIAGSIVDGKMKVRRIVAREPLGVGKLEMWIPDKNEYGLPTGIENALKQILPEIIFIEAFKDPSAEAQSKGTATLAKILKLIVEQVRDEISEDVETAIQAASKKFNLFEQDGQILDERPQELKRVENRIKRHVQNMFKGSDVRLKFNLPGISELIATATVELRDRGPWTTLDGKGQGFQRTLYVALLQVLAEELRNQEGEVHRPFILLCEEPEVFLHPSLQRAMGDVLENISQSNQVVSATHSPLLVTPQRIENIIILRQDSPPNPSATIPFKPDTSIFSSPEDKQLINLLKLTNSAEFLFADYVLVVEGASDRALIESCWHVIEKNEFNEASKVLAIIESGNKSVVPVWCKYLRHMGYKARGLVDLDFLWNGAGSCMSGEPEVSQFCEMFWKQAEANGLIQNIEGNKRSVKKPEVFGLLATDGYLKESSARIRSRLMAEHELWVLSLGEIENYFGLSATSKGQYIDASQKVRNAQIEIHNEIREMTRWLMA